VLKGRLDETEKIALEFEEKFEKIRQLWNDWAENIRKIRANAPDTAIEEVVDRLKKSVISG